MAKYGNNLNVQETNDKVKNYAVFIMEYNLAIKNKIIQFDAIWVDLEIIMLSDDS